MTDQGSGPADPERDPHWELVRAAARRRVPTPPGLVERVLRSVSGVRGRRGAPPIALPSEGGSLSVSETVVVQLARAVAAEVAEATDGVHVSAVAFDDGELQVLATVRFGVAADEAAELLRDRVTEELERQLGSPPPTVNVHVVDVHPD